MYHISLTQCISSSSRTAVCVVIIACQSLFFVYLIEYCCYLFLTILLTSEHLSTSTKLKPFKQTVRAANAN